MAVPLLVKIAVFVKSRDNYSRWRQTQTYTENWTVNTTSQAYSDDIISPIGQALSYAQNERAVGNDASVRYSLRLENPTAPTPPKGAWVQAKQNFDGHLTNDEFKTVSDLHDKIIIAASAMIKLANAQPPKGGAY